MTEKKKEATSRSKQIIGELGNKGHRADKFAVLLLGAGEQAFGEVRGNIYDPIVTLTNPKRFICLRKALPDGQVVQSFMIGDWDYVTEGSMFVRPIGGYYLKDLSPESEQEMLELFQQFLDRKKLNSAAEAGIVPGYVRPK